MDVRSAMNRDRVASYDLEPLMNPRRVAVVGASQRAARGTRVVANLKRYGYGGQIYPINPKYDEVLGLPCYPDLASTPEPADSVVIAIPAEQVLPIVQQAADAGVRGAVILSSGFSEAGEAGRARHAALEQLSRERRLPICGPNCYGVFNIHARTPTFSGDMPEPLVDGHVALISQSGGFSTMISVPLMRGRGVGFSYVVSCGNQAGTTIEDYLEFMVEDERTRVIAAFVEGFKQPAKLRAVAARAAERRKALVVMKVGRSENARQATLAHTGSLAGTPEIIEATLRQSGIVQVFSLNEMIETVALLAGAVDYYGPWRTAVCTGSGGECGHVADAAAHVGIDLPPLSPASIERLKSFMPDFGNPRNPLDGTGAMYENPAVYPQLVDTLLHEDAIDIVALNMGADAASRPGGRTPQRDFSKVIRDAIKTTPGRGKLVFAFSSAIGGALDEEVIGTLAEAGVPFLEGTETAMLALRNLQGHRQFLERHAAGGAGRVGAPAAVAAPTPRRRGVLGTLEARQLLEEYGIPVVRTAAARTADEAVAAADELGYPVVLKVESPDVLHKSDVGGVRVGCADAAAVRAAYAEMLAEVARQRPSARLDGVVIQPMVAGGVEVIIGVKTDPLFGPAVVFGLGGILVEVLKDVAIRVPPLDAATAREMVEEIRGAALLRGVRGHPPADMAALADAIVRLGQLAHDHREHLVALDLNPVLALPEGQRVTAVDWLIQFDDAE
jgi:acetate---CoA ligase (ADP-forming)